MIGSWPGKFVGFIGGYNLINTPTVRLRIYFQIVTPTVRLRIGGAADAVTTAYGGVVVFRRNMHVDL